MASDSSVRNLRFRLDKCLGVHSYNSGRLENCFTWLARDILQDYKEGIHEHKVKMFVDRKQLAADATEYFKKCMSSAPAYKNEHDRVDHCMKRVANLEMYKY